MYIRRAIENEVVLMASEYPVITITGPRQSGKTTLCKHLFKDLPYYSMENPDVKLFVQTDPRAFLNNLDKGAIIDEVQNVPEIISYIQQIVDEDKYGKKFILAGSNNFSLVQKISQSLAGRTAILKLLPFSLSELHDMIQVGTDEILFRGFYPIIYNTTLSPTKIYRNYYETYLERDLRQLINIKDLVSFQKFIRVCAGRIGNVFNVSSVANEIGVSVNTIKSWLSILEASFVLFRLQPFHENINKRLIKSPKIFFYDVGLATYLLGIENVNQLSRDPLRGALFENMVIVDFLKERFNLGLDSNLFFYRDSHHNEVDLLLKNGNEIDAIEIKSSQTFHPDFMNALNKFSIVMSDRLKGKKIIYDGKQEGDVQGIRLINFRNMSFRSK